MRTLEKYIFVFAFCSLGVALAGASHAQTGQIPWGGAFSYQGVLLQNGQPVNGNIDMVFDLYDAGGTHIAGPLSLTGTNAVPVLNGIFTVALDFESSPFLSLNPGATFLQVSVNGNVLSPRTQIQNAPYSLQALNALLAYSVSNASIGAAQIIPSQVQQRVASAGCPGQAISAINQDGSVICQSAGSGTVTNIATGTGLAGGPVTGSGTISIANGGVGSAQIAAGAVGAAQIDESQVQHRFTQGCAAGSYYSAVGPDGTPTCTQAVTSVNSGTGLTGGPITATGTLSVDTSVIQPRITGRCAIGEYVRGIAADGSLICATVPAAQRITTVDTAAGLFSHVAIGADSFPIISYQGNSGLTVAHCIDAACAVPATITAVDSNAAEYTSIAIGTDLNPVISYFDVTNHDLKVAHCPHPDCSNTAAVNITTVDTALDVGLYTSIAIGADSLPIISYYDAANSNIKVAHCTDPYCSGAATITNVDAAPSTGQNTTISIGADSLPIISYFGAGWLKVAHCSNAACTGTITITQGDYAGQYPSMAIGADSLPVISYIVPNNPGYTELKVGHCANTACTGSMAVTTVETLSNSAPDSSSIAAKYTSIAIGADSLPIFTYFDTVYSTLRVVHCPTTTCTGPATITTVDAAQGLTVGPSPSIAIGTDSLPVISYAGSLGGNLKVVKCNNRICQ